METARFVRQCPTCANIISYHSKKGLQCAASANSSCQQCGFERRKNSGEEKRSRDVLYQHSLGLNNVAICRTLGVSFRCVRDVLEKHGLKSAHDNGSLDDIDKAKLRLLIESGASDKEVAQQMGMRPRSVTKYRRRWGYRRDDRKRACEDNANTLLSTHKDDILQLIQKGAHNQTLCSVFGATRSTMSLVLKKLSVQSNTPKHNKNKVVSVDSAICYICKNPRKMYQFKDLSTMCQVCEEGDAPFRVELKRVLSNRARGCKKRAEERGVEFSLTVLDLVGMYVGQGGKCFYTGEDLNLCGTNVLSIDKIIPERGYINENVVLCTNRFNTLKRDMTLAELHTWLHPDLFNKILSKVAELTISK